MKANKKILIISLLIAILGLLSTCFHLDKPSLLGSIFINSFHCLRLEIFQSSTFNIFIQQTETSYYSINFCVSTFIDRGSIILDFKG